MTENRLRPNRQKLAEVATIALMRSSNLKTKDQVATAAKVSRKTVTKAFNSGIDPEASFQRAALERILEVLGISLAEVSSDDA